MAPKNTTTKRKHLNDDDETQKCAADRRLLRCDYFKISSLINQNRDDIAAGLDSQKFDSIIKEVEDLHLHVKKPREQVADAETLLNLTSTLMTAVKQHTTGGVTHSEFIACLMRNFAKHQKSETSDSSKNLLSWREIGLFVSPLFQNVRGCSTMLGPMDNHMKPRKVTARRNYARPTIKRARPEEIKHATTEEKTETDQNMLTMFEILSKKRSVKLEHLLLNRKSFAQTVENLFALSFLVRDGRVAIVIDESGSHIVSPRNQPPASSVSSGEVKYSAFIFRFDFKDWKLMKDQVEEGEELMPNRVDKLVSCLKAETATKCSKPEPDTLYRKEGTDTICSEAAPVQEIPMITPLKMYSRKHGMVAVTRLSCKRKLEVYQ
ncbi:hypothetical protein ACET3Z_025668 [Daucus carota]